MSGGRGPLAGLVIGVGNSLRGDDGVGPAVVRRLAGAPAVRVREVPQLLPELADDAARADVLVIVDAALDQPPGELRRRPVAPSPRARYELHELSPADLLAVARELHGRCPETWLVTIGVAEIEYVEGLSAAVEAAVPCAVREVRRLLGGE